MAQRLKYPELAPEGIAALSGLEHYLNVGSGLEPVLLEFVRLRASLLNGCDYCVSLHSAELRKHHEPESRIATVATWQQSEAFTRRERAGLRWAEVVTNVQDGHAADEEFQAVREHFADAEVVNLTLAVAGINAWNRLAIAFRPQWQATTPPVQDQPASVVDDDGGKAAADA